MFGKMDDRVVTGLRQAFGRLESVVGTDEESESRAKLVGMIDGLLLVMPLHEVEAHVSRAASEVL